MNILKKYKNITNFLLFIIIITTITSIICLLFPIQEKTLNIIYLIALSIYSFIISYKKGKTSDKKGYKVGLKIGLTNIAILYILSILFLSFKLPLKKIIYYLIILTTSILGSIIGINKKNQ